MPVSEPLSTTTWRGPSPMGWPRGQVHPGAVFFGRPLVFCDTEYGTRPDGRPIPRCAVFLFDDGRELRFSGGALLALKALPFDIKNTVFVCYSAPAEIGVFLELGLPLPHHICDLYAESLALTNGRRRKNERVRILDMLARYGRDAVDVEEKAEMRALALRGPRTPQEEASLEDYCASDTHGCGTLLCAELPDLRKFHPDEILFRGRFMAALARSHRVGVPVDTPFLRDLDEYRAEMALAIAGAAEAKAREAAAADPEHCHRWDIYDGARFTMEGYKGFLHRAGIKVPPTPTTGQPTTSTKVLEKLETEYPQLAPLRECMNGLDALSKLDIPIDADDRVRIFSRPFGAITGRSTKGFFSYPKWLRPSIKPPPGFGVGYLDAKAQEHLIAGARSGDRRMIADYFAGDVHQQLVDELGLTEDGGQAPRDRAKVINHATAYGQRKWGLAKRLGISEEKAGEILREHQQSRRCFYQWRQGVVNGLRRKPARTYFTRLGWPFWTGRVGNDRTMMNFPPQSDGADWMRVVMIAATEASIMICASAHDGFLIMAPIEYLERDIARMKAIMVAASEALFGYPMFIDCDENARAVWPDRLMLGGKLSDTWRLAQQELHRLKQQAREKAA